MSRTDSHPNSLQGFLMVNSTSALSPHLTALTGEEGPRGSRSVRDQCLYLCLPPRVEMKQSEKGWERRLRGWGGGGRGYQTFHAVGLWCSCEHTNVLCTAQRGTCRVRKITWRCYLTFVEQLTLSKATTDIFSFHSFFTTRLQLRKLRQVVAPELEGRNSDLNALDPGPVSL